MDPIKTRINDGKGSFTIFKTSSLINDLGDVLDGSKNELITFVTSYLANIYIGTSTGRILHYHRFSDIPHYMLISQIQVSSSQESIMKIVVVSRIERVIIIAGSIASTYTLPELSTCRMGKIKDVKDISVAPESEIRTKDEAAVNGDKIIVLSKDNISLLSMTTDSIHMIKRISYSNGTKVLATRPKSSGNALLAIIANDKTYDIIDLSLTRKIPLFEYKSSDLPTDDISPQIEVFEAQDKDKENEYILTIQSDSTTSLSMFINDLGDVTRGTIVWSSEGIPVDEIMIQWPYTFGLFKKSNGTYNVLFSSLESLEIVHSSELSDILNGNDSVADEEKLKDITEGNEQEESTSDRTRSKSLFNIRKVSDLSILEKETSTLLGTVKLEKDKKVAFDTEVNENLRAAYLISSGTQIWLLHEQEALLNIQQLCDDWINTAELFSGFFEQINKYIKSYGGDHLSYLLSLRFIMSSFGDMKDVCIESVYDEKTDNFNFDPRLIFYLLDEEMNNGDHISGLTVYSGVLKFIDKVKSLTFDKKGLLLNIVFKYYKNLVINPTLESIVRKKAYSNLHDDDTTLNFIRENDSEHFISRSENEDDILHNLNEQNFLKSLLFVFEQKYRDNSDEETSKRLCDICLKILDDDDKRLDDAYKNTLIDRLLEILGVSISDRKLYESLLLKVLKLDVKRGIEYLKKHKKSRFSDIHKDILGKLSNDASEVSTLNQLKLDYLESSFFEESSISTLDELILHIIKELEKQYRNEIIHHNFSALLTTFRLENSLRNSDWAKVGWIDFLSIHKQNSECEEFVELYLKLYELLQVRVYNYSQSRYHFKELLKNDLFSYLSILVDTEGQINLLIEYGDYTIAEFFALHGTMPTPRLRSYKISIKQYEVISKRSIKDNLKVIFQCYIRGDLDEHERCVATKHFIQSYGELYFTSLEVLNMVPDDLPLVYLQDYLTDILILLRSRQKDLILKKTLFKRESSFNWRLYNDLKQEPQ